MDLIRFPVHRALARPQMFAGVTYSYFIINAAVTTEVFLITKSFLALPVAVLLHIIGYLACLREPRIFDLWLTKVSRCPRISNWRRWRCNRYGGIYRRLGLKRPCKPFCACCGYAGRGEVSRTG